jgi:osmoprotectant transport system substrate-binding protein
MKKRMLVVALCLGLTALVMAGCTQPSTGPTGSTGTSTGASSTAAGSKGTIVIGSKLDGEGSLLGQIIIQALEAKGFTVTDKTRTGTTDVVRKALTVGEIDGYPEYTATALNLFFKGQTIPPSALSSGTVGWALAKQLDAANNITWLAASPANNTFTVAIPKTLSDSKNIKTMADLAKYVNGGGTIKIAGSQEYFSRADGFPSFEKAYGFKIPQSQKVILATGDTSVTEKAAASGTNGVNAAMAYGTDGAISALGLVTLEDPKGAQPVYSPAPTFKTAIVTKYPEIATTLDPIFAKLDTATLQKLNGEVAVGGKDAKSVAKAWLVANGFLTQ